jgi:hypothetical protein
VASNTASSNQAKQITITPPDASYEPAALAVLAGLYLVEPGTQLLADLTPQQQVQAAVLADMWQLPEASQAAISVLQTADSTYILCALLEQMLAVAAVPECLLPVFEHSWQALLDAAHAVCESLAAIPKDMQRLLEQAVLSKYGDLEAVWAPDGAALQESLLDLPLHAIELLLASDKLKVSLTVSSQRQCRHQPILLCVVCNMFSRLVVGCALVATGGQRVAGSRRREVNGAPIAASVTV